VKTYGLITKEILHRKVNFLLSLFAVTAAVALFVFFLTTSEASKRETSRLMRDIGFNLRIVSKDTDMDRFWKRGFSEHTMPEEYAQRFATEKGISYNHLLAMLQGTIQWRGRDVSLKGIASEVAPPGKKKPPMIFSIDRGDVHVGFEIARSLGISKGDLIEIQGKSFEVAGSLSESGTVDDITLYFHLGDAQELLDMEGLINEIKALECLCRDENTDSLELLREQLAAILPDARVIKMASIASAREKQRLMTERYFALSVPFVLAACAVWICVLAVMNVRDRKREIGVLRALGYGSGRIAALFLGKAVVIGLAGAAIGFFAGTALSLTYGPGIFRVTAKSLGPEYALLPQALVCACAFTALCSGLAAVMAITSDPAMSLRDD